MTQKKLLYDINLEPYPPENDEKNINVIELRVSIRGKCASEVCSYAETYFSEKLGAHLVVTRCYIVPEIENDI